MSHAGNASPNADPLPQPRLIRAVAVGNRITRAAGATEATFNTELARIIGLAVPHLDPERPNLLVLGELLGLPAGLIGPRGGLARRAWSARSALALLALANGPRIARILRRWPGTPLPRALLLALTDTLYRPFVTCLSRLAALHRTHIVASTLAPRVRRSADPREIALYRHPRAYYCYAPTGPEVYNAAIVFGPDGAQLGRVEKVNLTPLERDTLRLTPGRLDDVRAIPTAAGRLGVAISLDAFTPAYLLRLAEDGAEIVVQPDANAQLWAAPTQTADWQPQEWLDAVLGSVQPAYTGLRYNVCAMQTGLFYDLVFDGQSSITAAAPTPPDADAAHAFVGTEGYVDPRSGAAYLGRMLAVAPWVMDDPAVSHPGLSVAERRARLTEVGAALLPGGKRAGDFRESVIAADLRL